MKPINVPPEVSVVICTRNRRALLAEAVASVQEQTGVQWEMLVVDDASTDDTHAFLDKLQTQNIRCFRQRRHSERSAARNLGLAHSYGEFVMFLDDDDLLHPGALAVLKTALDNNPDAVAAVGARRDRFCDRRYERRDSHPHFARKRNIFDELLFGWSAVSGQNLYRTDIVRSAGGYADAVIPCEDRDLWLRVARLGPVMLCPETVMTYRIHHGGQWRPDNLLQLRESVARSAIRRLPKEKRRRGLLLRKCTRLIGQSEGALSRGRFVSALWFTLRAVVTAPGLFTSPLIGPWVLRRMAGRAYHWLHGR